MAGSSDNSLYHRLGGYEVVVRLMEGVCGRMLRDERLGVYFKGHNSQSKKQLQYQFIHFVVAKIGGPDVYCGNDMKKAHEGLNISSHEWHAFRELVREAIKKYRVDPDTGEELLAFFQSFEREVVEVE